MHGCLHGIRIVDMTANVSGPFGTAMLGDMGADVIKVEAPGNGDISRRYGMMRGGMAAAFAVINRNKRGVALDLQSAEGKEAFLKLVASADVVTQNFRPGVVDRLGVGYEACKAVKKDIIYISISGFGDSGPHAGDSVYDPVIQAVSGYMGVQTEPGTDKPMPVRTIVCDKIASMSVTQGVLGALFARERFGMGQHVKIAMLDASLAFLWPDAMSNHTYMGDAPRMPEMGIYHLPASKDGYFVGFVVTDEQFQGLCRAIERPDIANDPRFVETVSRQKNQKALNVIFAAEVAKYTTNEIVARFQREKVPAAKINNRVDILSDPQILHNGMIIETEHPDAGPMRTPRPPIIFGETPSSIRRHAPQVGAHTEEVLAEVGYSAGDIAAMRKKGVLG
ncbi:MAG: CoA transferase [Alphaproteobacteria bacterium]|nr:CoA transferase [Alphaproteobacteria bacterium]